MLFNIKNFQSLIILFTLVFSSPIYSQVNQDAQAILDSKVNANIEPNNTAIEDPEKTGTADLPEYKYYDVEVVLFRHNNDSAINEEYWPAATYNEPIEEIQTSELPSQIETSPIYKPQDINNNQINTGFQAIEGFQTIEDNPIDESQNTFVNSKRLLANYNIEGKRFISLNSLVSPLDSEQLILNKEMQNLKYSRKYQLLAHFGWRQPGLNAKQALPVQLLFDQKYELISGEIKIVLSRYLHTKVDINLNEEVCRRSKLTAAEKLKAEEISKVKIEVQLNKQQNHQTAQEKNSNLTAAPTNKTVCKDESIHFKQSRKMRSKELHYIDHPVFGLLIQINPSIIKTEIQTELAKP